MSEAENSEISDTQKDSDSVSVNENPDSLGGIEQNQCESPIQKKSKGMHFILIAVISCTFQFTVAYFCIIHLALRT